MSKGGSSTSQVEIPAWLENTAIENINRAREAQQIGYVPYYGPDVAAFSPMQTQAMQATGSAASAFGLAPQGFDAMAGMPQVQEFDGGLMGYSSAPLYEQAVGRLHEVHPAQAAAIEGMFIDPVTGQMTTNFTPTVDQMAQTGYTERATQRAHELAMQQAAPSQDTNFNVNTEYNPYTMVDAKTDVTGDNVIDYRDASFGEAGRRDIGVIEQLAGALNPFGIVGKAIDYGEGLADGFTPAPEYGLLAQHSGTMEQTEAQQIMNEAAARYEQSLAQTIPDSTLTSPEVLLAQAYGNTPAVTPYVDTQDEADVFAQPVVYTPPTTTPSDFGARDWTPPTTVTSGVSLSDITTGTGQAIVPSYEYNSSGRVGFGYGL